MRYQPRSRANLAAQRPAGQNCLRCSGKRGRRPYCGPCGVQVQAEHKLVTEARMNGARIEIDFAAAPITRLAGWRRSGLEPRLMAVR